MKPLSYLYFGKHLSLIIYSHMSVATTQIFVYISIFYGHLLTNTTTLNTFNDFCILVYPTTSDGNFVPDGYILRKPTS